jgi:hypothetical protein
MAWAQILSPSRESFERHFPLIEEGYALAVSKHAKRLKIKP